jgi:molybdate transport system substrate-binding protein
MTKNKLIGIVLVLAVAVSAILLAAWPKGKRPGETLILCGGTMRAAMEEVVVRYQKVSSDPVKVTYGDSSEVCVQLQQTRQGDLVVCHDPFMAWGSDQGLIQTSAPVALLDIVLVVPKDNPKNIKELKDLAKPGLRIGAGNPKYSTAGEILDFMLGRLDYGPDIKKNIILETRTHQPICTDVAQGTLDAGIVWNSVARLSGQKLDIYPIPKDGVGPINLPERPQADLRKVYVRVGLTKNAGDNPAARRFYDFAVAQREVFESMGFTALKD